MKKTFSGITRAIRTGLAMVIPILFIGSITVLLNSIPIEAYQKFLDTFLGGALRSIISIIQKSTVGILAVFLTISLNLSFMRQNEENERFVSRFGSLLGCLTGFFILVGFFAGEPDFSLLSGQGVFSALLAGLIGSALYRRIEGWLDNSKKIFVDGADSVFNAALHVVLPFLGVVLFFAVVNYIITLCFDVASVQHLFMKAVGTIFSRMHRSFSSGLLFTALVNVMWLFGIHGNNVLNQVAEDMFTAIVPGEIVSKSFIDTFVIMGGTGCLIGLLIAMVIFGRRNSTKKLSRIACVPCLFNISELLVFGFPIIYNPTLALPFIMAPILCFSNAFLLTKIGFMPEVTNTVVWTTPPLLSGYLATGSFRGVIVQIINIAISVACYAPFVIRYEKKSGDEFSTTMSELVDIQKKAEETTEEVVLTECEGNVGRLAKLLVSDLEDSISASRVEGDPYRAESPLIMNYQPQFDNEGRCIGAEALLRWNHVKYGIVYPPLAVRLAKEGGDLFELETYIIEKSISDSKDLRKSFGDGFRLSVNVTLSTLYDKRFIPFLRELADRYMLRSGQICLEITEEAEISKTEETGELLRKIRAYGYSFALDDLSMGHISLQYLQHNRFDIVKLDGSLVRSLLDNERTKEIINSIVYLSKSLDFKVLAEYVETEEQRAALEEIGCCLYQGYLFGAAMDKESLKKIGQN